MTFVDIVSYAVAAILAFSRILNSAKPFWKFIPAPLGTLVPSVVAMLPVLAEKVGAAQTGLDLVNAVLVAGALLLPGAGVAAAEAAKS